MSIPIKTLTLPISSGGSTTETEYSFITPEDMDQKANVDGYYENLVSGGTEQILSSVYEEDSEPYLFRTSGGSIDIGDREVDTIVGGTIAFNQMVAQRSYTNSFTDTRTNVQLQGQELTTGVTWLSARSITNVGVYPKIFKSLVSTTKGLRLKHNGQNRDLIPWESTTKNLIENHIYFLSIKFIGVDPTTAGGFSTDDLMLFDLTVMFGTTIADYIYSLEQANEGAGVAWFKKLFPKPYYEYNAGELLSVEGLQSHDMVGFNAWDEEWEVGTIDYNTGANYANTTRIRSKNYIPVLPDTVYTYTQGGTATGLTTGRACFYDADKNFIAGSQYFPNGQSTFNSHCTFTTPANACYMRISPSQVYGASYKNDICINLHWDGERDGEYEPYVKHSYPLDDSLTLRGIPKLDSNNKLYYDGDIYEADGTVTRKYGIVDLGTLTFTDNGAITGGVQYKTTLSDKKYGTLNIMCSKFVAVYPSTDIGTMSGRDSSGLVVFNSTEATAAAFKTAMSGVYLVYELATPTTEQASPYTNPQIVDDFGTEEYVTDSIVPVGHVTKYMPNLKAKLEMAPDSPSDNGDYIVRHTNGLNEYVPLVIPTELPAMPTGSDGTYVLKATVTNGTAVLSWEAE